MFVLSFFLCFIPYIGGFISTGIAFLLTVALGSTVDVVIMGIWTIVFNIVTGNIVSPIVYGRTVHLHPAIVLVAIPAGGRPSPGILGMFIVVPVLGVVAATWRTVVAIMGMHGTPAGGPTAPGADTTPIATGSDVAPTSNIALTDPYPGLQTHARSQLRPQQHHEHGKQAPWRRSGGTARRTPAGAGHRHDGTGWGVLPMHALGHEADHRERTTSVCRIAPYGMSLPDPGT